LPLNWQSELFSNQSTQAPGIDQTLSTSVRDRRERSTTAQRSQSNLEQPIAPRGRGGNQGVGFTPINLPPPAATSSATKPREATPEGCLDGGSEKDLEGDANQEVTKSHFHTQSQQLTNKEQEESEHDSDFENADSHRRKTRLKQARQEKRPARSQNERPASKQTKKNTGRGQGKKSPKYGGRSLDDEASVTDLTSSDDEDPSESETNPEGLDEDEILVYDPEAVN
jgi:hypothetical protein